MREVWKLMHACASSPSFPRSRITQYMPTLQQVQILCSEQWTLHDSFHCFIFSQSSNFPDANLFHHVDLLRFNIDERCFERPNTTSETSNPDSRCSFEKLNPNESALNSSFQLHRIKFAKSTHEYAPTYKSSSFVNSPIGFDYV